MTDKGILLSLPHKKRTEVFFQNMANLKLAKEILFQAWWNSTMGLRKVFP